MQRNPLHFIFINGRGSSGKDTQADLLVDAIPDSLRISTGDIYRGARTPDGEYGRYHPIIGPYVESVDNGNFLPDEVILPVVWEVIAEKRMAGNRTFIFTGLPRTVNQLNHVDGFLSSYPDVDEEVNADFISYSVLEDESIRRSETRRKTALELGFTPRPDDDPEKVMTRLKVYEENTDPMLRILTREGRLHVIKSSGTIDEVHARTRKALGLPVSMKEGNSNPYERR